MKRTISMCGHMKVIWELEKKYPGRIVGIDAARSIEEIKIDIYKKLEEVLKGVTE